MHRQVPSLRGGLAARLTGFAIGLLAVAYGIVAILRAGLGLAPWDVLHQGVDRNTPLTFGQASIAVSIVVVLAAWILGHRPGPGTVANFVLVGLFIDVFIWAEAVPVPAEGDAVGRVVLMLLGILLFGAGTALYLGARLGIGPRDSLMLVASRRLRVRVGVARGGLELLALGCGAALGGTLGLGTLAFALLIGWSVELSFGLLRRSPLTLRPPPEIEPRLASGR